jgi:hypothetical protein
VRAQSRSRSSRIRPLFPSPVSGSVWTCSSSRRFSRTLIARRTITAIIVSAQSIEERPVVALIDCIVKRPIITVAKSAGTISSRQLLVRGPGLIALVSGCQTAMPSRTAEAR